MNKFGFPEADFHLNISRIYRMEYELKDMTSTSSVNSNYIKMQSTCQKRTPFSLKPDEQSWKSSRGEFVINSTRLFILSL